MIGTVTEVKTKIFEQNRMNLVDLWRNLLSFGYFFVNSLGHSSNHFFLFQKKTFFEIRKKSDPMPDFLNFYSFNHC